MMVAANNNYRARVTLDDTGSDGSPVAASIDAENWLILADEHGNNVLVLTPGQAEQLQRLIEQVRA